MPFALGSAAWPLLLLRLADSNSPLYALRTCSQTTDVLSRIARAFASTWLFSMTRSLAGMSAKPAASVLRLAVLAISAKHPRTFFWSVLPTALLARGRRALSNIGLPLSLATVLGDGSDDARLLRISASFLIAIHTLRNY